MKEEEEKERQRRIKEEEESERKRKEEEEREREKERKRIQVEEERKKKEAAAAKKAEQDRLRKEEEKKRKEEEKRRKEEEKKKQEEEKKKAEDEKKKQEEDRKKREEMAKRQNEALKRLQEQQQAARAVKPASAPTPAPWTPPEPPATSLADIQKTERKQQQQLREQQEMLRAFQEKHQQEQQQQLKASKSGSSLNLKWAENTKSQPTRVKSLAEIQAEEHEHMAKQAEKEKAERMAAGKEVSLAATASIWATANQSLSWNSNQQTASVWGTTTASNAVSGSGPRFWDEVSTKPSKPVKAAAPAPPPKSQAKIKAKKDEASVMKLFEKQLPKASKADDFNKWCTKTLVAYASNVDIPTFVDFLLSFESHKEVREYIRMYLGETKEANDFASEFIDRRTRLKSAEQGHFRPEPPAANANTNHFQEVKGKNKKVKKNKMTKVDSRILGFNVTAAPDRINVGDRDYGEGL